MLFKKSLVGNSRVAQEQFAEVMRFRQMSINSEIDQQLRIGGTGLFRFDANSRNFSANEGLIPDEVYQQIDAETNAIMTLDEGEVVLSDLLPLSQFVSIGKVVSKFRQASSLDPGVITSLMGQSAVKLDQVEYTHDGAIVPIHQKGFYRNWREREAQLSEAFDAIIDDSRETARMFRNHVIGTFMDGMKDDMGNYLVFDAISWKGMRNDTRVSQFDLGAGGLNFDFTSKSNTGDQIKTNFMVVRDNLMLTNKCNVPCTYYFSNEAISTFEEKFSTNYNSVKILDELKGLTNVADIKGTSLLTGNEFMAFPLNGSVKPIVGMGINTVMMPRTHFNDNYNFLMQMAAGWKVKTDYEGNTCALYASEQ